MRKSSDSSMLWFPILSRGDYCTFPTVLQRLFSSNLLLIKLLICNLVCGNPLEEYLINICFNYKTHGYNGIKNIFSHFETIKL